MIKNRKEYKKALKTFKELMGRKAIENHHVSPLSSLVYQIDRYERDILGMSYSQRTCYRGECRNPPAPDGPRPKAPPAPPKPC